MPRKDYTAEIIKERLDRSRAEVQRTQVTLEKGDTAWDPTSTKHPIFGPGRYEYARNREDRGVTLTEVGVLTGSSR